MSTKYKVTLSPRYDTYWGREDLAFELHRLNLPMTLLPANMGTKRSFERAIKHLNNEGIQFVELKESTRDKSWQVYKGMKRKPIGSFMVTWGQNKKGKTWTGSKVKVKDLSKTPEGLAAMDRVKLLLTEALTNPGANAYTFHLKVLDYLANIADAKLPRESWGLNGSTLQQTSYFYVVDHVHWYTLLNLRTIYKMFWMELTVEVFES